MPGWNFADVWEVVAEQLPDAPAQVQGDRRDHLGASSTAGPTASPHALLDAGVERAGQGRPVPLQLPRVPRVDVRRLQGRAVPVNTNYRYARRRARLPLGQRRRGRRRVPRHLRRAHRAHPRPGAPRDDRGCGSTTAAGPCPDWAIALRGRPPTGTAERVRRRRGAATATTSHALHRRHHRHAQGRDVAPGRPVPQPRRRTLNPAVRDAEADLRAIVRRPVTGARARRACPPARSCTAPGCFTQLIVLSRRRLHGHAREPQPRRRRAARHDRARAGQHDRHRRRRLRQADAAGPRRRPRPLGPRRACS